MRREGGSRGLNLWGLVTVHRTPLETTSTSTTTTSRPTSSQLTHPLSKHRISTRGNSGSQCNHSTTIHTCHHAHTRRGWVVVGWAHARCTHPGTGQ